MRGTDSIFTGNYKLFREIYVFKPMRHKYFFSFLLSAAAALADTQTGTVRSGTQPIPGAAVKAECGDDKLATVTDENGQFALGGVTTKPCKFTVTMYGFAPVEKTAGASATPLDFDVAVEGKADALKRMAFNAASKAAAATALAVKPAEAAKAATPDAGVSAVPGGGRPGGFQRGAAAGAAPGGAQTAAGGRPGQQVGGQQAGRNGNNNTAAGFQALNLAGVGDAAAPGDGAGIAPAAGGGGTDTAGANESFLVNGSLSQGIQQTQADFGGMDPGMREAMMSQNGGGFGAQGMQGGFGGPGGAQGGPGGGRGSGPGGPGGGFGGPGGGEFGGGGGGRGGGGGGGQRQGGPRAANGNAQFGNRINRGRNQWRLSANYTLRNSAFDARNYSLTGNTVAKAAYAQNRYGFSGGGPLVIPKLVHSYTTFLFINYTGARSRTPFNGVATVANAAQRTGDFSGINNLIYDPTTGTPFVGNRIPSTRIDPIAAGLLQYIPLPNQISNVQNYQFVTSNAANDDNLSVRVTQSIGKKDNLSFNVNYQNRNGHTAQTFGFLDASDGYGLSSQFSWSHTFNRSNINRFGWNFSRNIGHTIPYFETLGLNIAGQLGISGVSNDPINYGPPSVSFTNFGALTDATSAVSRAQTSALTDSWIHIKGKHTLTLGGEFRRQQNNPFTDSNGRGSFSFTGASTGGFTASGLQLPGTGYDFADFLLSRPQSSSVRFGSASNYFRTTVLNGYATDDWKAKSNLTINAGLRYEYFTPTSEKYGRLASLDINSTNTAVAIVTPGSAAPFSGGTVSGGIVKSQPALFSPRIGVAWKPWPKKQTLIRFGYGIYFNGSAVTTFASRLASQPPFASTATLQTSTTRLLTLANGFPTQPANDLLNTFAVDPNYHVGYAQTWNFAISYQLPRNWTVEGTYLGTKGTRLDIQELPNAASPGSAKDAETRRPITNATGFTFDTAQGNSIYHSLQTRLTRRFTRGVSINMNYTFAKSIDNVSSFGAGGASIVQDYRNLRAERGLSSFDNRHALQTNFVLTSPVNRDRSGMYARLTKDWTLNGGLQASSGTPYTARANGDIAGVGSSNSSRALATGLSVTDGSGYFNTAAFATPLAGTFGNAGRNTIPGLARWNTNLSFGRSFRLDDRRNVEFRMESQNTLNHVNITGIQTVVNSINYGSPTAAGGMRTILAVVRLRF